MRITELCESVDIDADFDKNDKHGLGYDLADDLLFFMHHDDDAYRRHTYPSIMKAADTFKANKETDKALFSDAVKEAYTKYQSKYNSVQGLPAKLDEETLNKICEHLHTEELKKIQDGHYED